LKLFLSWSGKMSRDIAVALDEWLPYVIQSVKPFVSTGDIDKGRRWSEVLASELAQIGYGIIIVTRDNIREPWINFEAGAISKALDKSWVSPFLFGIDPSKLDGPLQQFQATVYEQEDVFNLLRSINSRLPEDNQVPFEVLRNEFDAWWPKLRKRVDEILATQELQNETGYDWLYTAKDLSRHISRPKHVWIVAQHLYRNALVPPTRDVINQNVKAGTVYTFLVCEGEDGAELHRMAANAPGQIRVVELGEHEFQSVAVTDYFILDPDSDSSAVFLELPIQTRGYWIEVDREAAIGLVERFRTFVSRILTSAKPADLGPAKV
jgi:hypothetical protein